VTQSVSSVAPTENEVTMKFQARYAKCGAMIGSRWARTVMWIFQGEPKVRFGELGNTAVNDCDFLPEPY
jgi:hypothetical protein